MRYALVTGALTLGISLGGCPRKTAEPAGGQAPAPTVAVAEPGAPDPREGLRVHQDLLQTVHLADVRRDGLVIDFGTPAHLKYTFGDWSGNANGNNWAADGRDGTTTFANVGQRGRVFFSADTAGDRSVRLRIRQNPNVSLTPYLNGTALSTIALSGGGFHDVDFALPGVREGENQLMLVFSGGGAGAQVLAAIDSVRIVDAPAIPAELAPAPMYDGLVGDVRVGAETLRALTIGEGTTISYYLQVPAGGKLGFRSGATAAEGRLAATVSVDGDAPRVLPTVSAGSRYAPAAIDLADFAGKVVRLDLTASAGDVALAELALLSTPPTSERVRTPRNVIVLLIDTLRADRLRAFNPSTRVRTPTMDALGPEGALFVNAHAVENWTKPTVASILTGLYTRTHQIQTEQAVLPSAAVLVSEHLKDHGFTTASFIANGYVSEKFGFRQGWNFHTNFIREEKNTDAAAVFEEAGNWIEQNRGQRFFTYIHTVDPHVPYDPPAEYLRMYDPRTDYAGVVHPRRTGELLEQAKRRPPLVRLDESDQTRLEALHDGEITQHDAVFGQFIERMKRLGVWDDTLFILTADHGEEFRDHDSWGHGHSVFEELLHVPLYVRLPGTVPAGLRVTDSVSPMSIPATMVELLGVPEMPTAEGQSLADYFRGTTPTGPRLAFSDWAQERRVVTVGGRFKLIVRGNLTSAFFDLAADPHEDHPVEAGRLGIALRFCRIHLGAHTGTRNRARWLEANPPVGVRFDRQDTEIDPETREGLRALGYAN